jgi:hypothetical protein
MYVLAPVVSLVHSSALRLSRVKLWLEHEFQEGDPEKSDKNLDDCYEMVVS